jgi:predicted outer membrane protein
MVALVSCKPNKEPQISDNKDGGESNLPERGNKYVIDATFEAEYLVNAYASGLYAIKAAEIIQQKSKNKEFKVFAENIVNSHQKIVDNLDELASVNKMSLPSDLNFMQRNELKKLKEIDPQKMEAAFVQQMELEHIEDIELLEEVSMKSEDNQITTVAIVCLSTLKSQYEEIISVKEKLQI